MTRPACYGLREDSEGWTVFDIWTGQLVVIALIPQTGLDVQDADEMAELLSLLADRVDLKIHQ
jgi:hypothetical protein